MLVTTDLFITEVVEHANWAIKIVAQFGEESHQVIDALRGAGGYRKNQFLDGYFLGPRNDGSFGSYCTKIFDAIANSPISDRVVAARLESFHIRTFGFDEWDGFDDSLYSERDSLQDEIADRRKLKKTFKHDRQTKAEAEVVLIIDRLRKKEFRLDGGIVNDASFVSSTRVVDGLPGQPRRICLLPDGLAQWLWSSEAISEKHAEMVFEQLLWDLALDGIEFLDRPTLLRRFSGVVEAARAELSSAIKEHREIMLEKFGPDPESAFTDTDPMDVPRLSVQANKMIIEQMEKRLALAESRALKAEKTAELTVKEKQAIRRMNVRKEEQSRKAKKGAAQRRTRKKGGKKKK